MRCTKPLTIRHDIEYYQVPCGKCLACTKNKTAEWALRLMHEYMTSKSGIFITLTYRDEPEEFSLGHKHEIRTEVVPRSKKTGEMTLKRKHIQDYIKELRRELDFTGRKIRYFFAGEYGKQTYRPHYHGIIFNMSKKDQYLLETLWRYGNIDVGDVNYMTTSYSAKYIQKRVRGNQSGEYYILDIEPEFALMSRRPGIGSEACKQYLDIWKQKGYITIDGYKKALPRFYQNKLTEEDKEYLKHFRQSQREEELNEYFDNKPNFNPTGLTDKDYLELGIETHNTRKQRDRILKSKDKLFSKERI